MLQYFSLASIILYLLACFLDSFKDIKDNTPIYKGFANLFFGWLSLFHAKMPFIAWCANVSYFVLLFILYFFPLRDFTFNGKILVVFLSVLSVLLGSSIFSIRELPANEAGATFVVKPYMGAYIWWGSFWVILLGIILDFCCM